MFQTILHAARVCLEKHQKITCVLSHFREFLLVLRDRDHEALEALLLKKEVTELASLPLSLHTVAHPDFHRVTT